MTIAWATVATLLLVVWQVLRFEATQPIQGWDLGHTSSGVIEDHAMEVVAWMRPSGPGQIHDVEPFTLGSARMAHTLVRPRMDCESDHLWVEVRYPPGTKGWVGFTWLRQGILVRRPVREALRFDLSTRSPEPEVWKRYVIPRLPKRPQGRWVPHKSKQRRALRIPDVPGEDTSTPLPAILLGS